MSAIGQVESSMPKPKLTKEEVKKWKREIELSLEWRKPYQAMWERNIDYFKGLVYEESSTEHRIAVNMVYPYIRVAIPAIYSKNPDVIVSPRKRVNFSDEVMRKRAEVMQKLLRYLLKELDVKTEVKLCLLDAILTGHSWVKTGYETEFLEEQKENKKKESIIDSLLKVAGLAGDDEDEAYDEENAYGNSKILSERPWALRCSPFDMLVPAFSKRPDELYWVGERCIIPYDKAMENDDWDTDGLKPSLNANELLASLRGGYKDVPYANDMKYIIKYEIWDRDSKQIITLSDELERPLQVKDSEYTFLNSKYHPYVNLRFTELLDEFYPYSDITPAEPQLLELNDTRTQLNTHRKRYNRRYATKPGALSNVAKADLREGADGLIFEVEPTYAEQPLEETIMPVTDAPLPPEVYASEARVKDDILNILGTNDYATQESGGARTATEAAIVAAQSRFRVEERIDVVGTFVLEIITNLSQISQRFMGVKEISNILGLDAVYWVQTSSIKELRMNFLFDVVYGSSAPINRDIDREQFNKFYAMTKDDPYYDQIKLRLELARKYVDNAESWLVPQIAQELEKQRLAAAKTGALLGMPQNAQAGLGAVGRLPRPGTGRNAILSDSSANGEAETELPPVTGGRGGTAKVKAPF